MVFGFLGCAFGGNYMDMGFCCGFMWFLGCAFGWFGLVLLFWLVWLCCFCVEGSRRNGGAGVRVLQGEFCTYVQIGSCWEVALQYSCASA